MCNSRYRQRGVTIVELIIFMVIMGVAAAGIMQVMNLAVKNSADPARRKQAMLIAEAFMEEVQQAQMTACDPTDAAAATAEISTDCASIPEKIGPETTAGRPYDNVNDYVPVGYKLGDAVPAFAVNGVDVDVAGNPVGTNAAGGALGNTSLAGYTTTLALNAETALGPAGATVPSTSEPVPEALRITIRVTYGTSANDVVTLDGYRTRYAPGAR